VKRVTIEALLQACVDLSEAVLTREAVLQSNSAADHAKLVEAL
jgi:hypothetical protein